MNRVFNLRWSHVHQAVIPVPECGRGAGRRRKSARRRRIEGVVALVVVLGGAVTAHADPAANALPTGGQIVGGSGSISQSGNAMTVNQTSDRMIANWNSFNIGSGASVQFVQPGTSSIALNRVLGGVSQIFGALKANGQVYLINPNGIVFGQSAQVDVGGVVASSLNLSNADFLAGRSAFSGGAGAGSVVNQGMINAGPGGVVALIAPRVSNEGAISAPGGSVALAAGAGVTLDFVGDGLVRVKVDQATFDALVENKGVIVADGGIATMTARSANALLDTVINNEGMVRADTIAEKGGRIVLDGGEAGVTRVAGTLQAAGTQTGERGGDISVTGDQVAVVAGALVDASGPAGGGTIRLGGGRQGQDASIRNAIGLTFEAGAVAKADATDRGNGGSVTLWSDGVTNVGGSLSAQGGINGGNGGFVETSGHVLNMGVLTVKVGADAGKGGTWLIDPVNISIGSLAAADISAALTGNATVVVTTNACPSNATCSGTDGDITVASSITAAGSGNLTLQAQRNITLDTNIAITTTGTIILAANSANVTNGGEILLSSGSGITTNGGNIVIGGGNDGTGFAQGIASGGYGVRIDGATLNAGSGNISVKGKGFDVPAMSANSYGGTVNASSNGLAGYGVRLGGAVALTAANISITGTGGYGGDATNTAATGPALPKHNAQTPSVYKAGDSGSRAVAGNGNYGVMVDAGAAVGITATTAAVITATGGTGGNASTSNDGGAASGGNGADGYHQDGAVTFTTPTATIDARRSLAGTASSAYYTEYDGGHMDNTANPHFCADGITTCYTPVRVYQGLAADYLLDPVHGGTNGTTATYGMVIAGDLKNVTSGSTLKLLSLGDALQTGGSLIAPNVLMQGDSNTWTYTFKQSTNNVDTLSARADSLYYRDSQDLLLGTVGGVSGVVALSRAYIRVDSKTAPKAAALIQNTGATPLSAPTLVLNADTMQFNGNDDTVTGNDVGLRTVSAATPIVITATDPDAGNDLFLDTAKLGVFSAGIGNLVIGGNTNSGSITVNGATFKPNTSLVAQSGNISLTGNITVGAGKTLLLSTGGTVGGAGKVTAPNLVVHGSAVDLQNAANSVQNVAANVTRMDMLNTGDLTVNAIGARSISGGISWDVDPFTSATTNGITASDRVYVNTTGNLSLSQGVSGGGSYTTMNGVNPASMNERMAAAVVLTAGGHFYNNYSTTALSAAASRWLVYSDTPDINGTGTTPANHRGGQSFNFKLYAWDFYSHSTYNYDARSFGRTLPGTGNGFLYSVQPTVTITPTTGQTSIYGNTPTLSSAYTSAGYIDTDASDHLTGTVSFSSPVSSTSSVGTYDVAYSSGLSMTRYGNNLGYRMVDNTSQTGEYTITRRAITVTPDNGQTKIYGDNDPTFTYQVTGLGLVNGDSLAGALSRITGENVGNYNITQGGITNAANGNYDITFTTGRTFAITARPVTIVPTDGQWKISGSAEPTFQYSVVYTGNGSKSGLVFGNTTTGILGREPGETTTKYAYLMNTLGISDGNGGANYTVTLDLGPKFEVRTKDLNLAAVQTGITGTSTNNTTSTNTQTNNPVQLVGAGTGSSTVANVGNNQVLINNTTVFTGAGLQLSSGAGNQSLSVSRENGSVTVTFGGGSANSQSSIANSSPPAETGLSLFVSNGKGVQSQGDYVVMQKGQTLSASAGSNTVATPSTTQSFVQPPVSASIDLPGGGSVPMSVGISTDGVLVIKLPPEAGQQVDSQTTMLLGLALAKQNFGSAADGVKAVLIQPAE